jgi:MtN3 and saliva related transmembrane protein
MREIVTFLFGLGFVFNASLFIPQALQILKAKSAKSISLLTFAGFNFIQFNGILYGYFEKDWILMYGSLISFLSCGIVTLLATYYKYYKKR